MDPSRTGPGLAARVAFLVSTTPDTRQMLQALAPALEAFGTWRPIEHPESGLAFAAHRAAAEGFRPVHLSLRPLQGTYFTPAVPTIAWPLWDYPDIPDRDFGSETRRNWVRVARGADLIATACRSTSAAFASKGLSQPIEVIPIPLDPAAFDLPDWDPTDSTTLHVRHLAWGGDPDPEPAPEPLADSEATTLRGGRAWRLARSGFHRIAPRLGPRGLNQVLRLKHLACYLVGRCPRTLERLPSGPPGPGRMIHGTIRVGYRRVLRRWLSPEARSRIVRLRNRTVPRSWWTPPPTADPLPPASPLTLRSLVYTAVLDPSNPRDGSEDLLSAFLLAFRDRPDVSLVLVPTSRPDRRVRDLQALRKRYLRLGFNHRCRLVVLAEPLDNAAQTAILQATTFAVDASRARGTCLPLQIALASGRPAIAPAHTALADIVTDEVGFIVASHPEPTRWPGDPSRSLATSWYRPLWLDLHDRLLESALIIETDPARYASLSSSARRRMLATASLPATLSALSRALDRLPNRDLGAFAWAS